MRFADLSKKLINAWIFFRIMKQNFNNHFRKILGCVTEKRGFSFLKKRPGANNLLGCLIDCKRCRKVQQRYCPFRQIERYLLLFTHLEKCKSAIKTCQMGSFFQCTSCSLGRFTNFSLHGPPTSYPNITKKYPNCTLKRNELFRLPRLHLTRQICCSALVNFFKCFSRIVSEGLERNKWVIQISIRPFTRFQVAPTKFIWPEQPKLRYSFFYKFYLIILGIILKMRSHSQSLQGVRRLNQQNREKK